MSVKIYKMNWIWKRKNIKSDEYLALEAKLSSLSLRFTDLELELGLILSKLKFKYKITKRDLKEEEASEDIKTSVLLPE